MSSFSKLEIHKFLYSWISSTGLGNTAPTAQCAAGYYCPGGQDTSTPSGLECFAGHYCPQGSNYPIMCSNGTHQPNPGQDGCLTCPAGYFCDSASGEKLPIFEWNVLKIWILCKLPHRKKKRQNILFIPLDICWEELIDVFTSLQEMWPMWMVISYTCML